MEEQLKILLLEDSEEDVTLIQRELMRGGIQCLLKVVDAKEDFEKALEAEPPNIILCDHSMPMFNSFEALASVKTYKEKYNRTIPFILVTGTVTEEFAAQCIHAGADDYILKDRLRRLPEAVKKALEKAHIENERQAYLQKVLESQAQIREAERLAGFGSWKASIETGQVKWSEGAYRLFDYEPWEIKPTLELFIETVHAADRERVREELSEVIKGDGNKESEFRIITHKGTLKHLFSRTTLQRLEGTRGVLVGFIFDLTERRIAEQLLEKAYRLARIGGWELNLLEGKLTWTDVTREIHEVPQDFEPELSTAINFYKLGESRETIENKVQQAIEKGEAWDVELQIVSAKGNERWVRAIGKPVMQDGKCIKLYGSFQDIHDRKKAEIELETQNEKLRQIAWTQSHEVRAPMASLLGLIDLLGRTTGRTKDEDELLERIVASTKELDGIVRKVVRMTEEIEDETGSITDK